MIRKGDRNKVDGEKFFDREAELEALEERVREGTHTLLTARWWIGKTSLVQELQCWLAETGDFEVVFVDLEAANNPADAVGEIGVQVKPVRVAWDRIMTGFANLVRSAGGRIEKLSVAGLKVKLRAGIDAGNGRKEGTRSLPPWRRLVRGRCSCLCPISRQALDWRGCAI